MNHPLKPANTRFVCSYSFVGTVGHFNTRGVRCHHSVLATRDGGTVNLALTHTFEDLLMFIKFYSLRQCLHVVCIWVVHESWIKMDSVHALYYCKLWTTKFILDEDFSWNPLTWLSPKKGEKMGLTDGCVISKSIVHTTRNGGLCDLFALASLK